MRKRDERRKLELRRERLRQLSGVPRAELGQVAGGTYHEDTDDWVNTLGRVRTQTCYRDD